MFSGIFNSPLDDKHRAVLPSRLREAIAPERLRDGFVITQGFEGCLMMFLREHWQELESRFSKLPFTHPGARLFKRFFLTPALEVAIDRVGRVMLSDSHRDIAGVKGEVLFNGMGDHIEIWSPARWKKYQTENAGRYEEVAATLLGDGTGWPAPGPASGPAGRPKATGGGGADAGAAGPPVPAGEP